MKILLGGVLLALLSGCATMNAQDCRTQAADALGDKDGREGYPLSRLERRVADCAKAGVTFDRDTYLPRYREALQHYCTPQNGEREGYRGMNYMTGTCPAELEPAFLAAYRPARQLQRWRECYGPFSGPGFWPHAPRVMWWGGWPGCF